MKASLLAFVLSMGILSATAQDGSSSPVLMFSGSALDLTHASSRNVTADSAIGRSTSWGINTGLMYGKWKGNSLLYYGLSFFIGGSSNSNNQRTSSFLLSPRIGLMKKIRISQSVYYMPGVEGYLGYGWVSANGQGSNAKPWNFSAGVTAFPFAVGFSASPKLDLVLTMGSAGLGYIRNVYPGNGGADKISQSTISLNGQLNSLGVRVLLKI